MSCAIVTISAGLTSPNSSLVNIGYLFLHNLAAIVTISAG